MELSTVLWIILSLFVALGVTWFQYFYKTSHRSKVYKLLFVLRFLAVFGILLLLINPKIIKNQYQTEKTPLVIAVDNSRSIKEFNQDETALSIKNALQSNDKLGEKYDIQLFGFDSESKLSETFDFGGNQTRIDLLAKNLKNIYRNKAYPVVLLTDGNQTSGGDYLYSFENEVFPVVLGDTLTHFDLKINQLNANKYAFHKNKFPVEVFLGYSGDKTIEAEFAIQRNNQVIHKEKITFSENKKSVVVNVLLEADKIGVQVYKAVILSGEAEKNSYNNIKNFAVEIIDQKTEIAIISDINHPDLGALRRSIETNEQNKVSVFSTKNTPSLTEYDVVILYQPTGLFQQVFSQLHTAQKNYFLITGKHTDFNFLNSNQEVFTFKASTQKEDYTAAYKSGFSNFAQENIGFENFPPLENPYGNLEIKQGITALLEAKIRNINTQKPLLFFSENGQHRTAYLLGENIWKWRLQHFSDNENFEDFDVFVNKTIQFLASDNKRKSLVVTHENFYNSGENIEISAQYFNKNYEFDQNARLSISVKNKLTNQSKTYDLLKSHNYYKVNLSGLEAGEYAFSVKELSSNTAYSGNFEIIDFDIEKQHTNADWKKLSLLAQNTNGKTYFSEQTNQLIDDLLQNEKYQPIEKQQTKKLPLIDFWTLLCLIAALFGLEWFIRKYNGLL
jgi:competence protein ComGC